MIQLEDFIFLKHSAFFFSYKSIIWLCWVLTYFSHFFFSFWTDWHGGRMNGLCGVFTEGLTGNPCKCKAAFLTIAQFSKCFSPHLHNILVLNCHCLSNSKRSPKVRLSSTYHSSRRQTPQILLKYSCLMCNIVMYSTCCIVSVLCYRVVLWFMCSRMGKIYWSRPDLTSTNMSADRLAKIVSQWEYIRCKE